MAAWAAQLLRWEAAEAVEVAEAAKPAERVCALRCAATSHPYPYPYPYP